MTSQSAIAIALVVISLGLSSQARAYGPTWEECEGTLALQLPTPATLPKCIRESGPQAMHFIRLQLGESEEELNAHSSLPLQFDPLFVTDSPINIQWSDNGRNFTFRDVGGTGQSILLINLDWDRHTLSGFEFSWQNRPLTLREAIEKAQELELWLGRGGFKRSAGNDDQPFLATKRDGRSEATVEVSDWSAAEKLLLDEPAAYPEMHLFTYQRPNSRVMVTLENARRKAWQFGQNEEIKLPRGFRRSIFDGNGGYEWFLKVRVERPSEVR